MTTYIAALNSENKAAGGLNGQLLRRTANFTNPTPLDEE
jgi:hypothetical protein